MPPPTVFGFVSVFQSWFVVTRCHRAQQLEQNRKDGQPEGGSGGDTPGGMEEAQDFTQRAYTDYHATLQVPSTPSYSTQPAISQSHGKQQPVDGGCEDDAGCQMPRGSAADSGCKPCACARARA
eukprot:COSAG01_NODE_1694_length_9467_cov_4.976196_3_plen_124_part_00